MILHEMTYMCATRGGSDPITPHMSITSVRQEIKKAMVISSPCSNASINAAEMKKISAQAAKDGKVSPGEALLIDRVLKDGHENVGVFMTEACPEHPGNYFSYDAGAKKEANALFARFAVPYGDNVEAIKERVSAVVGASGWGPAVAKAPSTTGRHSVDLTNPEIVDGPNVTALLDSKKGDFYIKVSGGPQGVSYFGPNKIDLLGPGPKVAAEVQALFASLNASAGQSIGEHVASSKLPALVNKYFQMKTEDAEGYVYGAPTAGVLKLADGSKIFAVTGIESDTVDCTAFFTAKGQPITMAEDGQGGFGWSSVWPDPRG